MRGFKDFKEFRWEIWHRNKSWLWRQKTPQHYPCLCRCFLQKAAHPEQLKVTGQLTLLHKTDTPCTPLHSSLRNLHAMYLYISWLFMNIKNRMTYHQKFEKPYGYCNAWISIKSDGVLLHTACLSDIMYNLLFNYVYILMCVFYLIRYLQCITQSSK